MRVGPLEKVVIQGYRDKRVMDEPAGPPFVVPINPESFSQDLNVKHERSQPQGAEGNDLRYRGTSPRRLSLKLLLDSTGTVEGNRMDRLPVQEQLQLLKDTVYDMSSKIHRPNYLKIVYSQLTFDCVLVDLKVEFVLFNSIGQPLRAKVTLNVEEFKEPEKRVKEENKQSPDLTHIPTVTAGDRLPLMTYRIYGDDQYYLQVARANGLTNFRRLTIGSQVVFPAIDKEING